MYGSNCCVDLRPFLRPLALALALATPLIGVSPAWAKIEADRGKTYKLASKHGPWMIMVTSLWGESEQQQKQAEEAANELVYQLRRKGIPAYIYLQDEQSQETPGVDRQGRNTTRKYVARQKMVGVVAGNYPNIDDKAAQQTLKAIKRFEPKIKVDGQHKFPQDVTLALHKAFLTRNPLLAPEDMAQQTRDPLLLTLNAGHANSLLENKGKYTLTVASFYGNSQVKPAEFRKFDKGQQSHKNISLENAARDSELLCATMRKQGHEAYVYHERFRSIVTVGSFKSKSDPEIVRLMNLYRAKYKKNDQTGQEVLVAEAIKANGSDGAGKSAVTWTMDPVPTLLEQSGGAWQLAQDKW